MTKIAKIFTNQNVFIYIFNFLLVLFKIIEKIKINHQIFAHIDFDDEDNEVVGIKAK